MCLTYHPTRPVSGTYFRRKKDVFSLLSLIVYNLISEISLPKNKEMLRCRCCFYQVGIKGKGKTED